MPELWLEQGTVEMQFNLAYNEARRCFLQPLLQGNAGKRTEAEALWHLAEMYRRQGNGHVSLQIFHKLGKEYPTAVPFGPAAASQVSSLGNSIVEQYDIPNGADEILLADLLHLLKTALELDQLNAVNAIHRHLTSVLLGIDFELKLNLSSVSAQEQNERKESIGNFEEYGQWILSVVDKARTMGSKAALMVWNTEMADEIADLSRFEAEDLNYVRFANRSRFIKSLSGPISQMEAAAASLAETLLPISQGPDTLSNTAAAVGEIAAMQRAAASLKGGLAADAVLAALDGCLAYHSSGVAGLGLIVEDPTGLEGNDMAEMVGCLTHVEFAIAELLAEKPEKLVLAAIQAGIDRLQSLREKVSNANGKKRIEKAMQGLKFSQDCVRDGATGRAITVLENEIYVSR